MSMTKNTSAPLRRLVLESLRARWGKERKAELDQGEHFRIQPFLESVQIAEPGEPPSFIEPSEEQMGEFVAASRRLRADLDLHPFQERADGAPREVVKEDKRRELLAEITGDHFRRNIGTWMSSTPIEHYAASTPVEELEAMLSESAYRLKLMTAALKMMSREVAALERQIRLKRELSDPADNS